MKRSVSLRGGVAAGKLFLLRGRFHLPEPALMQLQICSASAYLGWLDTQPIADGPIRFLPHQPEFESLAINSEAGERLLAFALQYTGARTRMLLDIPAFLCCRVFVDGTELAIDWQAIRLASNLPGMRRINPQLGWADARDTRKEPGLGKGWTLTIPHGKSPRFPPLTSPSPWPRIWAKF